MGKEDSGSAAGRLTGAICGWAYGRGDIEGAILPVFSAVKGAKVQPGGGTIGGVIYPGPGGIFAGYAMGNPGITGGILYGETGKAPPGWFVPGAVAGAGAS